MEKEILFKVNGQDVHLLRTNKFKTIIIVISLINDFTRENTTKYTLLSKILSNTCKKYPSRKLLADRMYELYSSSVSVDAVSMYKMADLLFVGQVVNGKLINNHNLLKDTFELFQEMMYNPNIENNGFNQMVFEEEKRSLRDDINNIYNNKPRYAFKRMLHNMAPDEDINISSLGYLDELEKINPENLYEFYLDIINNSMVDIRIIGDVTEEEVTESLSSFHFTEKNKINNLQKYELFPMENVYPNEVKEIAEYQDVKQACLVMGFRVHISKNDSLYPALLVFNAMFGGMFVSTIVNVVREENSLAYDIYSDLLPNSKLMIVAAGVDNNKDSITSDLVIKEFEKYKQGNIDEELLSISKNYIVNDYKNMEDLQYSLIAFNLSQFLASSFSKEEMIKRITSVTKENIISVANKIYLDTVYVLKAGEKHE